MITPQLLCPESIVVVGASNNVHKPGGAILRNLLRGNYQGELRVVNPREQEVQGVPSYPDLSALPPTDLAILVTADSRMNTAVAPELEIRSTPFLSSSGIG